MGEVDQQGVPKLADGFNFYCLRGVSEQRKVAMMTIGDSPVSSVLAELNHWLEWFPDFDLVKIKVYVEALGDILDWLSQANGKILTFGDNCFPSFLS